MNTDQSDATFPQPVSIQSAEGDLATISPYGAHVLSWIPAGGEERIFLSPKAEFRTGAAIRGGVPVIFPQFAGLGKLTKHGFARTMLWELARQTSDSVVFWLSETPDTYAAWPHRFLVEYRVRIAKKQLEMSLSITNTDIIPFSFRTALHGYLCVRDAQAAAVEGLQGVLCKGSASSAQPTPDQDARVTFLGEVDRIYIKAPARLRLVEPDRSLDIQTRSFPDVVVWNPGETICAGMADMEAQGYRQFVCVEAAAAGRPVRLATGESWNGSQTLQA